MYGVKAFRLALGHVQHLHRAKFETSVSDPLNNVACVSGAHRIGLNDCEGKIPHLLSSVSLIVRKVLPPVRDLPRILADERESEMETINSSVSDFRLIF
jgi:hypothetical protein